MKTPLVSLNKALLYRSLYLFLGGDCNLQDVLNGDFVHLFSPGNGHENKGSHVARSFRGLKNHHGPWEKNHVSTTSWGPILLLTQQLGPGFCCLASQVGSSTTWQGRDFPGFGWLARGYLFPWKMEEKMTETR